MSESDQPGEWPALIGLFITNFAHLEELTYQLAKLLPEDNLSKYAQSVRNFIPRARLLLTQSANIPGIDESFLSAIEERMRP